MSDLAPIPDTASAAAPPMPPRRSLAKRIALLVGSTLFSLLLGVALLELYFRMTTKFAPNLSCYELDFEIGKTLRPHWHGDHYGVDVAINSFGMRDREFEPKKPAGTFRAIALGDSWTFGVNVRHEETWPKQLEALLSQQAGAPSVEILNTGVSGYETYNEAVHYRRDLAPVFEHDLVLVGFYPVNDVHDKRRSYARWKTLHDIHPWLFDLYVWPKKHLLVSYYFDSWRRSRNAAEHVKHYERQTTAPSGHGFAPDEEDWTEDYQDSYSGWPLVGESFGWIASTAKSRGARGAVILFPDNQDLTRYETYCHPKIAPGLAKKARDAGLEFIDLADDFHPFVGRETEIALDAKSGATHVNGRGYEVIAKAVARELRARGLFPKN